MNPDLAHDHLIVNCRVSQPPMTPHALIEWMRELVALIDMKLTMGPYASYVDTPGNRGATGIAGIETSHIAAHFWEEEFPGHCRLDLYSCKKFDVNIVFAHLEKFGASDVSYMFLDRSVGIWLKVNT